MAFFVFLQHLVSRTFASSEWIMLVWASELNGNAKEITLLCHEGLMTLPREPNDFPIRA